MPQKENNKTTKVYTYDENGNPKSCYIIELDFVKGLVWEKRNFVEYEGTSGTPKYYIDTREIYTYDKNLNLDKIIYTEEGSSNSHIVFQKVNEINDSLTSLEAWMFNPSIKEKPFIISRTIIEKGFKKTKPLYRVRAYYHYEYYGKGSQLTNMSKYKYDKQNPEILTEIELFDVKKEFKALDFICKIGVEISEALFPSFTYHNFYLPILKTKLKNITSKDLPNKTFETTKSIIKNFKLWSDWLREDILIHETILKTGYFNKKEAQLKEVSLYQ